MKHRRFYNYTLSTFLLLSCITTTHTGLPATNVPIDQLAVSEHDLFIEALLKRVMQQVNHIEFQLEHIVQVLNTRKLTDDKIVRKLEIIKQRLDYLKSLPNNLNEHSLTTITEYNKQLICQLYNLFDPATESLPSFEGIRSFKDASLEELTQAINDNDKALGGVEAALRNFTLSPLANLVYQGEKLLEKLQVVPLAKRLAPYAAIGTWALFATNQETVDRLNSSFLTRFKKIIGGFPQAVIIEGATEKSNAKGNGFQAEEGIFGTPLFHANTVINLEQKPLFCITTGSLAAMISPYIKQDAQELYDYSTRTFSNVFASLKGLSTVPPKIKPARLTYRDIFGCDDQKKRCEGSFAFMLDPMKTEHNGQRPLRAFLLTGPRSTSKRSFAQAVGGELTQRSKLTGANEVYNYFRMSALVFLDKRYDQILARADNNAPCVIIITQVAALYEQSPVKCAQLFEALSKLDRLRSKILAFVTAEPSEDITKLFARYHSPSAIMNFELPGQIEREKHIRKLIAKILLEPKSFDIPQLARETHGCSYLQIATLIRNAHCRAFAQQSAVTPALLTQVVNEFAHGLLLNLQPPKQLAHLYATHWAGKAVAHELLKPGSQLLRVTILPSEKNPTQTGALVIHIPDGYDSFFSSATLEKLCTIELAGNAAAEILGDVASAGKDKVSYQKAFNFAIKSLQNGLDPKCFSKAQLRHQYAQALEIVERCAQEARNLLANHTEILRILIAQLETEYTIPTSKITQLLSVE